MDEPRYVVVPRDAGFVGPKDGCLSRVDTVWTDRRPRSVRGAAGE